MSFHASDEALASAFGKMKTKARLPLMLFIVVALWLIFLNDPIEVEHPGQIRREQGLLLVTGTYPFSSVD